ncbi:MAG: hypothetical protein ABFD64_08140 [Armatimonadota bacterium]
MFSTLRNERGNWTLVGLLVAVAIGFVLVFCVLLPRVQQGTGDKAKREGLINPKQGQTVVGASMDKGKETQCMSNLRQIRMTIESDKASGEQLPATIQDMGLGSVGVCPVSNQPYQYDPNAGTVKCTTPGHEGL